MLTVKRRSEDPPVYSQAKREKGQADASNGKEEHNDGGKAGRSENPKDKGG